jgi:hypothetical protein
VPSADSQMSGDASFSPGRVRFFPLTGGGPAERRSQKIFSGYGSGQRLDQRDGTTHCPSQSSFETWRLFPGVVFWLDLVFGCSVKAQDVGVFRKLFGKKMNSTTK